IELVEGTMIPKEVSARYLRFPYRIYGLEGMVHVREDGKVGIDLAGRHGRSRITNNGWDGCFAPQACDLRILGATVPLDDDLRACLVEHDRRLCQRFDLHAVMNLDVRLSRLEAPPGTLDNPLKSHIDVFFVDGVLTFDRFPYPLGTLRGRL